MADDADTWIKDQADLDPQTDGKVAEAAERHLRSSLSIFRPESAPTVLDMSPENSLSQISRPPPPSVAVDVAEGAEVEQDDVGDNDEKAEEQELSRIQDIVVEEVTYVPEFVDNCLEVFKVPRASARGI